VSRHPCPISPRGPAPLVRSKPTADASRQSEDAAGTMVALPWGWNRWQQPRAAKESGSPDQRPDEPSGGTADVV
jgi:hypothetical protein